MSCADLLRNTQMATRNSPAGAWGAEGVAGTGLSLMWRELDFDNFEF